jgi:phosphocarrier protein HPr
MMKEKELLIENKLGLHARAAAQIVKTASAYASKIVLVKDGLEVDGKSIMGIMMLAAAKGSSVTVQVHGEDEEQAIAGLERLFKDKFGEKE